jgi:hypothetical protein
MSRFLPKTKRFLRMPVREAEAAAGDPNQLEDGPPNRLSEENLKAEAAGDPSQLEDGPLNRLSEGSLIAPLSLNINADCE